jgi:hypothetical protein
MARSNSTWKLTGVFVLILAVFILWMALYLLPTVEVARGKGTFWPLVYTWGMVLVAEACTLTLAWFLLAGVHKANDY